jgi:hypothetical protein
VGDRVAVTVEMYGRCARASAGPLRIARIYRTASRRAAPSFLPCPDVVLVDESGAALACYADGRPVIAHPSFVDLLAMHALHEADLMAA